MISGGEESGHGMFVGCYCSLYSMQVAGRIYGRLSSCAGDCQRIIGGVQGPV